MNHEVEYQMMDLSHSKCPNCQEINESHVQLCTACRYPIYTDSLQLNSLQLNREDVSTFVKKKSEYYFKKFNKMYINPKSYISWNWAAFLLGPFWLFYRKQYIYAIAFLAIPITVSFFNENLAATINYSTSVSCGLLGNYIYYRSYLKAKNQSEQMSNYYKNLHYDKKGGTDLQVTSVLAILYIIVIVLLVRDQSEPLSQQNPYVDEQTTNVEEDTNSEVETVDESENEFVDTETVDESENEFIDTETVDESENQSVDTSTIVVFSFEGNIRQSYSKNSPLITTAVTYQELQYLDEQETDERGVVWYKVKVVETGKIGWISENVARFKGTEIEVDDTDPDIIYLKKIMEIYPQVTAIALGIRADLADQDDAKASQHLRNHLKYIQQLESIETPDHFVYGRDELLQALKDAYNDAYTSYTTNNPDTTEYLDSANQHLKNAEANFGEKLEILTSNYVEYYNLE